MATKTQYSFNAGEIDPLLENRLELDKYKYGCKVLENFQVSAYGPASFRPGTHYVSGVADNNYKTWLTRFVYSETTTFLVGFSEETIRFWSNGLAVESGGSPIEVASPYSESECFELSVKQINDVMYVCHPNWPVHKLTRLSDISWTFAAVDWDFPPLRDLNSTDITITPSSTTGNITLTASDDVFNADMVGGYFYLEHQIDANSSLCDLSLSTSSATSNSAYIYINGTVNITTSGYWWGVLELQRSDDARTWETVRKWTRKSSSNVATSYTPDEECWVRLFFTCYGDPLGSSAWTTAPAAAIAKASATIENAEAFQGGFVLITGYTDAQHVSATVKKRLKYAKATEYWREGSFSDYRGHPRSVATIDGSLVFGGNNSQPKTWWKSQTDDYENFEYGVNDNEGLSLSAQGERNPIEWMLEDNGKLFTGTIGEELTLSGAGTDQPLSPSSQKLKTNSTVGSKRIPANLVKDSVVYIQRDGKKVRQLGYDFGKDKWVSSDLTRISSHITGEGIVDIAFSQHPESILWAVREDGQLIGMSYEETENVASWFRVKTRDGDEIESVAVIPTLNGYDQTWITVKRSINGSDVRYVEYFDQGSFDTVSDAWRLDCAVSYENLELDIQEVEFVVIGGGGPYTYNVHLHFSSTHGLSNGDKIKVSGTGDVYESRIDGKDFYVHVNSTTEITLYATPGTDYFFFSLSSSIPSVYTGSVFWYTTTVPNIASHLNGEIVSILVDGFSQTDKVVSNGTITIDSVEFYEKVIIGLPYTGRLQTCNIDFGNQEGATIGNRKNAVSLTASFKDTYGGKTGPTENTVREIHRRSIDTTMDSSQTPITTPVKRHMFGNYDEIGVWVIQDQPLPMTLLSITTEVGVSR